MEGNVNWIPLGILGLIVVIWATKFLTAIRLKQKLKKAWDGAPFFRKKDTEESLIDSLTYPAKGQTIDSQVDDQTWHDLALDAVFDQLNYTQSSLGAEALYQKMRLLEFQPQDQLHDVEAFFEEHPDLRLKVQVIFNQLGKKNHNMARSIVANPGKHYAGLPLYLALACLPIVCLFAIPFEPVGAITLLVISVVFNIVFSSLRNWSNKIRLDNVSYLVRIFASAERLSHLALPQQEEAQKLLDLLGEMEVAISLLRHKRDLEVVCQPVFTETGGIEGETLYHPLLSNPIANDVHFQKNMVISGDNASGKSTYLKTVAINAILAQGLGFAYGERLALPYGHVLTAMDVSDDIEVGDSYFITESKAILRMIQHLKKPGFHYFFIDELFKGTNTIERIGSGLGIVRWLAAQNCLYMISSHDIELVSASGEVNDNYHFDSRYVDGKIVFDYQIKPGSAVTKNAVNTLESLHYPEEITQTAKDLIDQYEETGYWSLKAIEKE